MYIHLLIDTNSRWAATHPEQWWSATALLTPCL